MNQIDDGGPAFPVPMNEDDNGCRHSVLEAGMTLRDWFAGQAMPPLIAGWIEGKATRAEVATNCYLIADAIIAARKEGDS